VAMESRRSPVDRLHTREVTYSPHHEHAVAVTQPLGDHLRLEAEHLKCAARAKSRPIL
jgi:hypothetical protein